MKIDPRFALRPLAAALLLGCGLAHAQSTGETALMKRLDQLAAELAAVKAELATLQQQRANAPAPAGQAAPAAQPAAVARTAPAAQPAPVAAAPVAPAEDTAGGARYSVSAGSATVIGGYGEINYNRPKNSSRDAQADLRRAVLGIQHRFDERTKVVTELEVEHAVSSAGDVGEVALEQAYIEHQFTPTWAARAGLFLVPMGLINENHEPTAYYGVERNFVETAIIPSTWREGGVQAVGSFDNGLTLQAGVATGFNVNKWDPAEGRESPLGAIHQELAQAQARDLSVFGALNWRGIPGLLVGGGVFSGGASHGISVTKSRVTLWDLHARWTPGRWDLAAVYARGSISNSAALNNEFGIVGSDAPIPRNFDGGYLQAAYKLWESGSYKLKPFVRAERFNVARRYADGLGPIATPNGLPTERVLTAGANFDIGSGVVLKADYQKFKQNKDLDRFDLGLGWSF
ncbi:hypothetical protein [Azohydromonas australica]|uniref:hypothetical protein n=1 Tax=Azohydromonas australica TaxID=364039 RepID=UPI000418835D|nr:hypothetical protein [Azohydromonas australica]